MKDLKDIEYLEMTEQVKHIYNLLEDPTISVYEVFQDKENKDDFTKLFKHKVPKDTLRVATTCNGNLVTGIIQVIQGVPKAFFNFEELLFVKDINNIQ